MSLDSLLDSLLAIPSVPQSDHIREPLEGNENKASSPGSLGSPGISSLLDNAIFTTISDLPITADEIQTVLDKDDIENWINSKTSTISLVNRAIIALARSEINQGNIPAYFTKRAVCALCGPVWLWFEGNVAGCPWCVNRINNLPIPRPCSIQCGDCMHFERIDHLKISRPRAVCCADCFHFKRIDHPHLGHCAKGEPEAISGLWDTDRRNCDRWREASGRGCGNQSNQLTKAERKCRPIPDQYLD